MNRSFNINGQLLDLTEPKVMGILNLTPDSFYDGGRNTNPSEYMKLVEQMIEDGADFIDIGAFSSRPGAEIISQEEELERLIKPLKDIRKQFDIPLSIDTFRSNVANVVVNEGANMINDITAGEGDENMFKTMADLKVPYCLMHMKGKPETMQNAPEYTSVVKEVLSFLGEKVAQLQKLGVNDIVVDPGFGFGKTVAHNYQLLKALTLFKELLVPVMVGLSRKSMINKVLNITPEKALNGTTILHTLSLLNGASILRVHDVKEAKEAIKLVSLYIKTDF